MVKKRVGRPHVESVMRIIEVKSVPMYVTQRINDRWHTHRPGGDSWLQVRGTMDEPIEGQSVVEVSIHECEPDERGTHEPTNSIGTLIQLRPNAQIVLDMPAKTFGRLWTMAAGGRLRHIWLSMTKPKGKDIQVVSVSFQNEPIE